MREIKMQVFFYDSIDYSTGKMVTSREAFNNNYIYFDKEGVLKPTDDCTIIRVCTGEQDKDKKDIYSGDIIAVFHDQVIDGVILKEERGYKLYTVIYYKGMFCTSEDDDFPIGLWIHEKGADCQIMGNIFEDKELIK